MPTAGTPWLGWGQAVHDTLTALPARDVLNILDYGVVTGTASTQTAAIKAALDANPGKAFHFPPGDYRLDTGLAVTAGNSLHLAAGARLYAGSAMDTLIDYDNGLTVTNYAQDKYIVGKGLIDANLLASKALAVGSVIRFTLGDGLTIKDPINRGLVTKATGAETICRNLRLHNTGTTNVADNAAIECLMSDCHFAEVVARDFTIGAIDRGSATWSDFHPWIGTTTQLTARYADSVGFINGKGSILTRYYADTYRYDYRSAATTGFAVGEMTDFRSFTNPANLTDPLAAASPGAIFDLVDGGFLNVKAGRYSGHGATPRTFVQGDTTRFSASEAVTTVGGVTGIADYRRGVRISNPIVNTSPFTRGSTTSFAPNVFGSTTGGTTTYTAQTGSMEVRDGIVFYRFRVAGTLGSAGTAPAGNVRIGGLPYPTGAVSVSTGAGTIHYVNGIDCTSLLGANGTASPLICIVTRRSGSTSTEVAAVPGATFEIWAEIACPFTYPS